MEKVIIAIEGPSGVGKDSVIKQLIKMHPGLYQMVASYTTRKMRDGEVDGKTYHFVSSQQFKELIASKTIFEFTLRHGDYRGLSHDVIEECFKNGKIAIKGVDYVGLAALKKEYKNVLGVYITAPKQEVLNRLKKRESDNSVFEMRLKDYEDNVARLHLFDKVLTNYDIEECTNSLHNLITEYIKNLKF